MSRFTGPNKQQILAYLHRGDAFLDARQNEQAIACYQAALAMDAGIGEAYSRIGLAYTRLGNHVKAIDVLKKCTKIYKSANSFNLLGKNLLVSGDVDGAQKAYRRAFTIDKKNIVAVSGLAAVIMQKGLPTEAYKLIIPYIRKNIFNPDFANIATSICLKTGNYDEMLNYLLSAMQSTDAECVQSRSDVMYMIADIYDKKRNYAEAIEHYIRANDLRLDIYDLKSAREIPVQVKSVYSSNNLAELEISSCESSQPVFIVGMPRSGTTLTEQILSSHSKIYGAGELRYIRDFMTEIVEKKGGIYPSIMSDVGADELDQYAQQYLELTSKHSGGALRVVDKLPHNFIYLGFISQLFPNCKIIYCTRNPIDTCLSIYFMRFNDTHPYATRFKNLAEEYRYCVDMMSHWKSTLTVPILEVKYEDVVANLEENVERIISFCGLEMEQACLDFHKNTRFVNTASKDQVNQPLYTSSVERWKRYLPAVQPLVDALREYGLVDQGSGG